MNLSILAPAAVLLIFCAAAAWLDVTRRLIPNWLCAAVAISGLTVAYVQGNLANVGGHALHLLIALLIGMALFAIGGFGGGDAKFYAGVAGWFGLNQAIGLLLCVSLCGLLLLIGWFIYRRLRRIPVSRTRRNPMDGLPYGLAIAGGAMIAVFI